MRTRYFALLMGSALIGTPVLAESNDEQQAIKVLQSAAGESEKEDACRKLKVVGTAQSIPALVPLLGHEHLYQWALDVLETMPCAEAGEALCAALGTTSGKNRAGVAHALGIRRERKALPDLIKLLADADGLVASSAAMAVGRIGGGEAIAALKAAGATAPAAVHGVIVDALLACADRLRVEGDAKAASAIYEEIHAAKEPDHVRTAAYRGLLLSSGDRALSLIIGALKGNDGPAQLAAVQVAADLKDQNATSSLAGVLPEVAPVVQVALLDALGQRRDPTASAATVSLVHSPVPSVRAAARKAAAELTGNWPEPKFKKLRLSDKFYAEGAYYGDFNHDGRTDVVAGPFWFEGPAFQKTHEIRSVKEYDPKDYSDNFLTYTADFNGDGWTDVFYVGFPGGPSYWYENPAGKGTAWKQHLAHSNVGNESPVWGDINGDGQPELIFNTDGYLGFAVYDTSKPDQPWTFHAISPQDKRYQKFTHGVGFGDINGDKRIDMVEAVGWWAQPADAKTGKPWTFRPYPYAEAAAQMLVYDVDGDGMSDIITAWHCHHYGLVWYKQVRNNREIGWEQRVILPPNPDMNSNDLRISQLHAFELVDMNGDGLKDILTGKRFWAHGPKGDKEPDAPAVVYWFELRREAPGKATYVPHLIDNDSGVGTQVAATDLNGDDIPDVIVANKKGIFVHVSE